MKETLLPIEDRGAAVDHEDEVCQRLPDTKIERYYFLVSSPLRTSEKLHRPKSMVSPDLD